MSDEPKTDKSDNPTLWSLGCLCGLSCGIAGAMLGQYLGAHIQVERQAQIQARVAAIMRAKGQTFDGAIPQPFVIVGTFWGGCFGWSFGWLLTAFVPRRRARTKRDYLQVVIVGLLPLCILIALTFSHHLLR
jgi:hypothetical protein